MIKKMFLFVFGLVAITTVALAQTQVAGKVTDEKGSPIVKATITEKGTKNAVPTDDNGSFKITVKSTSSTLVITAVGFEKLEVNVNNATSIILKQSKEELSEIVVTGSGTATSKRKLGISVEAISADKLPAIPSASIDQALVGKIAGAQIQSVSGNPGDPVSITLRGINTIQGGTKPLILLDGVEIKTDLNQIDMNSIERVEVVQGAASATIYGAQGANGVIQLFSKKGKKGQVIVNFTTSNANNEFINSGNFGKADKHPYRTDANGNLINFDNQILKLNDQGTLRSSASAGISYLYGTNVPWNTSLWGNDSMIPGRALSYARYGLLDPRNNANQEYKGNFKYYDHFKQVFLGNSSINNALNIAGGGDKVDYNFSIANNFGTSPFLEAGYVDRTNIGINLGFEVFKNFKIRTITQLVNTINTIKPEMGAPGRRWYAYNDRKADVGRIYSFLNTSPFFDLTAKYDGVNYPSYQIANYLSVNALNPYFYKSVTDGYGDRTDLLQSIEADYTINKYVTLNAKYGVNSRKETAKWTYYNQTGNVNAVDEETWAYLFNGEDLTGEITTFTYDKVFQNFLGSAFIKTDFEKDFKIKFPIFTSTQISYDYRKQSYKEVDYYGVSLPLNPPINLKSTSKQVVDWDYNEVFVTYGYLVNQKVDFGNYGGVTVGFRSDYSSKFGEGSKPFTFPNYNAYLNLTGFKFWDNLYNRIPQFKLRYAYGEAGVQPGTFDRQPGLDQRNLDNQVTYSNQIPAKNPALDVEVSKETEYGFDLTLKLLNNSNFLSNLNISFTNWSRVSENVIYQIDKAPSTGSTSLLTNAINLSSKGFQFSLNMPVYKSKDFTWDLTLNLGNQASYIDKIAGDVEIPITASAGSTSIVLKGGGYKIGQIYGYRALTSLDQLKNDGKTRWIAESDKSKYEIVNGRVVNKTYKSIYFSDEAEVIGDGTPDYTGSIINSFNWKNIVSLGFQFDFVQGNDIYNQTKEWMYRDGISNDFSKPITINGQTGAWTAYYGSAYYALGTTPNGVGNNVTKDFFLEDGSFWRLRNVSLGIDLASFIKVKQIKKCQLVFTGRNLLTFTKYSGMDPEINSSTEVNSSYDRGIDHSSIPNLKSYQIGLNLTF